MIKRTPDITTVPSTISIRETYLEIYSIRFKIVFIDIYMYFNILYYNLKLKIVTINCSNYKNTVL